MKTITYHTEKEFRIGIMVAILAVAIFSTVKVRELQMNDSNRIEQTGANRIEYIHSVIPVNPYADAKLIDEPLATTGREMTTGEAFGKSNELAAQMKTWVNNKAYWSTEEAENDAELAHQMSSNLRSGIYFNVEESEDLPMDNENTLSTEMQLSLATGSYWNDDNN